MELFLTYDIETIPRDYESFSESQKEYLVRYAKDDEEVERKKAEMALTPLTAQVVVIGMQVNEIEGNEIISTSPFAYVLDEAKQDDDFEEGVLESETPYKKMNELMILKSFWEIFTKGKYQNAHLITFNGRNFDAPFLMLRSAIYGIRPSRNLMQGTKFNYSLHTDLIDELCFFSPSAYGATKRFNFDFYAREFGLTSPKSEGIDGSKVKDFYLEGRVDEIAEYCMRDVKATWDLYMIWRERLKF